MKGLVSSGVLPAIGHFYLWLRDLLCDMIHGTPLEGKVEAVKEWPGMDTSVEPVVPRGLVAAEARPVGQQNVVVAGTVRTRHSGEVSSMWMARVVKVAPVHTPSARVVNVGSPGFGGKPECVSGFVVRRVGGPSECGGHQCGKRQVGEQHHGTP